MKKECVFCKNNKEFHMPRGIIEAAENEDLIFFCGAGISTESKMVLPFTFYDSVKHELGINEDLSFSKLMSKYCAQPDGRRKLLRKIKYRLEDIFAFPELQGYACRFHNELSVMPQIKTIITTNWDDYFEQYCAATPITTQQDFAFWDCCDRRVLKIHGSINNISTIIATEEDYEKSARELEKGIIGATLKNIMATKTIVFVGFSFNDEDFLQILNFVKKEMRDLMPHFYIVTIDSSKKPIYENSTVIVTDGTFFVKKLKEILYKEGELSNLYTEKYILDKLDIVKSYHVELAKLNQNEIPNIIYCLSYQDGIIHGFERFFNLMSKGIYYKKGYIENSICAYVDKIKKVGEDYFDIAYIIGYIEALKFIINCTSESERNKFPIFYLPINERNFYFSVDLDDFMEQIQKDKDVDKKISEFAKKQIKDYESWNVIQHTPYF